MTQDSVGLTAVSSLGDPVRRRLYRVVAESPEPVGRDEAAAAAGIGRPLAAYHLDKLVDLGLLSASYLRQAGRGGPGAGRPAKLYTRSEHEFAVSVPPREYELAARLLAVAVESDKDGASWAALVDAARQCGIVTGEHSGLARAGADDELQAITAALRGHGFEPCQDRHGSIQLRNCPFHNLAALHPHLVCGMNLALIEGLIAGVGASQLTAKLEPQPGRCCVVIGADQPASAPSEVDA